ncbi:hypothetical protein [Streptomyces mirabilis]|uniref:hypothetical protein n=1 Tax=Streptomyces mirabilis TaxID=68239 RepID=UPI002256EFA9|nr:hypothetical protein [Streptomyces mirabilis]MCX4612117.1 hypothetical protein [Streptomyces mirabilis]
MIGLITQQARDMVEQADVTKKRKRERYPISDDDPGHAIAMGAMEAAAEDADHSRELGFTHARDHDAVRADDETAEKAFPAGSRPHLAAHGDHAADSPSNTPGGRAELSGARPQVSGPIAEALSSHGVPRTQVYEPVAQTPEVLTTLNTAQPDSRRAGLASSVSCNPGQASVQFLDFTHGGTPQRVSVDPARPAFHTASTGATPTQPRSNGNVALTSLGAHQ